MNHRSRSATWLLAPLSLTIVLVAALSPAAAAKAPGGFSAAEVKSIQPLLKRHGVIALSESNADGSPKAMTLAIRVDAPRDKVFKVLENPENFYYLSTLFKENKVLQKHDNTQAWSWASRHKLFSFVGTNTIALFPPRRADVKVVKSTIGDGVFTFTLHEDDPEHTIVVLSGLLDVQTSEWLIRYLLGGNPKMRQAMNIAIGIVVVKGFKVMAERMSAGQEFAKHRTRGKAGGKPRLTTGGELRALAPLLVRGSVVITDSRNKGRLRQATVIERVAAPADEVLSAISAPRNYAKMVKSITDVTVHETTEEAIDFSWTIGLSVFNLESRNRLSKVKKGVLIEGYEGDLAGSYWRWQLVPTGKNSTVVAYHSFADVRKAAVILEKTVKREPYLEHGLLVGSNMVMLGAVRRRLEK